MTAAGIDPAQPLGGQMTVFYRACLAGLLGLALAGVLRASEALAAPPYPPPAPPVYVDPRPDPGFPSPYWFLRTELHGAPQPERRAQPPGPWTFSLPLPSPHVESTRPAVVIVTVSQQAQARGQSPEMDVHRSQRPATQITVASTGSASRSSERRAPSATSTTVPAAPALAVSVASEAAGVLNARPSTLAARTDDASRGLVTVEAPRRPSFGHSAVEANAGTSGQDTAGPSRDMGVAPARAPQQARGLDDQGDAAAVAAVPAEQSPSTEPAGSSTLSDGHSGTSAAAYLAAAAALLGLGLGLRISFTSTLHLPRLTYAPPVPPG
jgi:hypothetical protein